MATQKSTEQTITLGELHTICKSFRSEDWPMSRPWDLRGGLHVRPDWQVLHAGRIRVRQSTDFLVAAVRADGVIRDRRRARVRFGETHSSWHSLAFSSSKEAGWANDTASPPQQPYGNDARQLLLAALQSLHCLVRGFRGMLAHTRFHRRKLR